MTSVLTPYLCKRASLVGEYILYLAQLLIQRCSANSGSHFTFRAVHKLVPVYEETLNKSNDLHTEIKKIEMDQICISLGYKLFKAYNSKNLVNSFF